MSRTPWTLIGAVVAGLIACTDGGAPQQPGDESSSGGGITTVANTGTQTASAFGSDADTGDAASTGAPTETTSGTTGAPGFESSGGDDLTTADPASTGGTTDPAAPPGPAYCGIKLYACGDGLDNDGDGLVDNADFECISPCDDDEGSFETDIPGQANDCKNDCFWDADSGAGQDKCQYDLQCDAQDPGGAIGCAFSGDECPAIVPQQCIEACTPLIPNGCDCFGCCHIQTPDGIQDIYLDSSHACSLGDLATCNHCTFQDQCQNPCEGCEVCFGQSGPPDGCDPDDGGQCDEGVLPCTMGGDECPLDQYCQTGCCQPLVVPG